MNDPAVCAHCGTAIPAGSPGGLCPRCLLGAGLEGGDAPAAAAPAPEEIAEAFPNLEILEVLGQGGMGIVYKARQRNLDRIVALKVLPPEAAREPGFAERFAREARTLARLQHPHIVGIHDYGESGGLYYLLMEYVDGANLRQVMRTGGLDPRQALAIVPQVCAALQYAHDQGVVHRDVKPENVLLDRAGNVKIADFGLAKLVQRAPVDLTLTRAGQVMGTVHYMAPEQYRAPDSVDHRADIYSVGVVFYEMLTGELPLGTFPLPSQRSKVDARVDEAVLRALERERERRWQKASDLGTRVDTIASGVPEPAPAAAAAGAASPPSPPAHVGRAPPPAGAPPPAASAAAAAPHGPAPIAVATTIAPRVSKLAVASALGVPASIGIGALSAIAVAASPYERHGLGSRYGESPLVIAFLATGGFLFLTLLASVVAWIRVQTSGGRLLGRGWAITGTVLSGILLLVGAPVLAATAVTLPNDGAPFPIGGRRDDARILADPPGGEDLDVAARRVLGGPATLSTAQRAGIAKAVEQMWAKIPLADVEPNPDVRALAFSPSERTRYETMSPERRKEADGGQRLGIPFASGILYESATRETWRLLWVALDEGGRRGRVVRSWQVGSYLAYPVALEDGRWYPTMGPVEQVGREATEADRSGWLDHRWYGDDVDPARRVIGGPADLDDTRRFRIAREVRDAWESRPRTETSISTEAFRLHRVRLEPTGKAGGIVVSDAESTATIPVSQNDAGAWAVDEARARRHPGPPDAADEGGWAER